MGPYIFIAAAVGIAAFMAYCLRTLRRKRAAQAEGERGDPHPCPDGSFLPVMRTRAIRLGGRDGKEFGMVVFDGLFCPRCKKEIICVACGATPAQGAIIGSEEERVGILGCCAAPCYELRRQGGELRADPPKEIFPPDDDGHRWKN